MAVADAAGGLLALVGAAERLEGEAGAADEGAVAEMVRRAEVGGAHHLSRGARALLGAGGVGSAACAWFLWQPHLQLLLSGERRRRRRESCKRCGGSGGGGRGGAETGGEGFEAELGLTKAASEEGIVVGRRSELPVEKVAELRGEREHQRRPCCDGDVGLRRGWAVGIGFGGDGELREEMIDLRPWRRRRRRRRGPHSAWSVPFLSLSLCGQVAERRERRGWLSGLDAGGRSGGHCTQ
jgi:hypothetical protein